MDISVILPTRDRRPTLERCLERLADQTIDKARYEILVGLDGEDAESHAAALVVAADTGADIQALACAREGIGVVKNQLIERARGEFLLFVNDDVLPARDFLERHLAHQRAERRRSEVGAMILGDSPWIVPAPDRLFDRLLRETPMIFFYSSMTAADPDRDWGFRCAWNLNLSVRTDAVREVAGFYVHPDHRCGYDDIELAWKIAQRFATPVLHRPDARAPHDHPYEPEGYLARERFLGRQAWGLAHASPLCARELFGHDVTRAEELDYYRRYVQSERRDAERARAGFLDLANLPADAVKGPHTRALLDLLFQQHTIAKRHAWREGLLEAAEGFTPPVRGELESKLTPISAALPADRSGARPRLAK